MVRYWGEPSSAGELFAALIGSIRTMCKRSTFTARSKKRLPRLDDKANICGPLADPEQVGTAILETAPIGQHKAQGLKRLLAQRIT
jgi:hypothetical protein